MKSLKSQVILIDIDMFPDGMVFLMAEKSIELYEELLRKLVKVTEQEAKDYKQCYSENQDANGFVLIDSEDGGKWQMIVFINKKDWKGTLVHESLHAVERLCEYRNIPIRKDTEELRAMLLGHIFGRIQEVVKV